MASNAALAALGVSLLMTSPGHAAGTRRAEIAAIVAPSIEPLMARHGVPGMAVAVVVDGQSFVYDFGVASKATGQPVTDDTLFEIGSLSKTFTATLVSQAELRGRLSLSDMASQDLPALRGSHFDTVSLLNLGTHTSGGLPLQFPDAVRTDDDMMRYFRAWTPTYAPGTTRTYANPSIGLLGVIAASRMDEDFDRLDGTLFAALGMTHTALDMPPTAANYAQGYTKADVPTRMAPGLLASEAYGVRTTAGDMARFVEANIGMIELGPDLQRAIDDTHKGYYRIGAMTQDLIWEQYDDPVALTDLLAGNSAKISYEPNPATRIDPPTAPRTDVLINKTGSTNGFGAYVAFIPAKRIGVVLLANKNDPIEARVTAAYDILTRLAQLTAP